MYYRCSSIWKSNMDNGHVWVQSKLEPEHFLTLNPYGRLGSLCFLYF